MPNIYMAVVCQAKTTPEDRKEEKIIRLKVFNEPWQTTLCTACVFHRESQNAKSVCTKHL